MCQHVDKTGIVVDRKPGSGRPRTARTADNIAAVWELICSQEDQPGTSKSTRVAASALSISHMSVWRIAHNDLHMKAFKRIPVQLLMNPMVKKTGSLQAAAMTPEHGQA